MISTTAPSRIGIGQSPTLCERSSATHKTADGGFTSMLKKLFPKLIPEIPLGYEDENGFHYGPEPAAEQDNSQS